MPDQSASAPSLDGRTFAGIANTGDGEVGRSTRFHYRESDGVISAEYAGGDIQRGYLVGTRDGDVLHFRYVHLATDGTTSSGRCTSTVDVLDDGRLRLHESWAWESRAGSGNSVAEEVGWVN